MSVVIVDYGSGNLRSAAKAFERMRDELGLRAAIAVTSDPDAVARAERLVLPGVGAFGDCRAGLDAVDGLVPAMREAVEARGVPFLGICVGMQLMASQGLEHGTHEGFGWIPGTVEALAPADPLLKIPHMGWNSLAVTGDHPVLRALPAAHAYFVHSYALRAETAAHVLASVDYGGPVTAVVGRDNLMGTQFHPEKSQSLGLALIGNFLRWSP